MEINLALAALLYQQGKQQTAVNLAQKVLNYNQQWQNTAYLQKQLWNKSLIEATQQLLQDRRLNSAR